MLLETMFLLNFNDIVMRGICQMKIEVYPKPIGLL